MFGSVPQKFKEEKPVEKEEIKDEDVPSNDVEQKKIDEVDEIVKIIEDDEEEEFTKRRKEKIHGYLPAIHEWRNDLSHHYESLSVKLGPISLEHLSNEKIFESLQTSQHFQIRLKRLERADDFTGHITVSFQDENEAAKTASELQESCNDVNIKHTKPVDGKPVDISDIIKAERSLHVRATPPVGNIIVMSRLYPDITENDIREKIPLAKSILIPKDMKTEESRLYAYIEMPDRVDVEKLDGQSITFGEGEDKRTIQLYKLKRYPPVTTVIKKLEGEKELFASKRDPSNIPPEKKKELLELFRLGCHYERSLYISDKKREIVAENMKKFRQKFPKVKVLKESRNWNRNRSRDGEQMKYFGFRGVGGNRRSRGGAFGAGGGGGGGNPYKGRFGSEVSF